MTLSSPAATGVLGHRPNPAPSFFGEPTQIWLGDTATSTVGRLVDFGDKLASVATTDVIELCARYVRDAGVIRVSHCVDDDYNLVVLNTTTLATNQEPSVVEVIAGLKKRLGVSERAVEQAAAINHTSHYNWKKDPSIQPRAGSLGGLWALMSTVDDLEAQLGDRMTVKKWLKEDRARLEALKAGLLRRLVDQETGAVRSAGSAVVRLELHDDSEPTDEPSATPVAQPLAVHPDDESWALDDFN